MNGEAGAAQKHQGLGLATLRGLALFLIAIHLYLVLFAEPLGDEAYYWLWGQHPALSYFDHPPLNGWVLGITEALVGWGMPAFRLPVLLANASVLFLFADWAKRLRPADHRRLFWAVTGAWYASPLLTFMTGLVLPDNLLVPLCLWSAHGFALYFEGRRAGRDRLGGLALGAAMLGLAGLAKYNAAFFGLAVLLWVLFDRDLRGELRRPWLWLAALLVIATQTPVLLWNLDNDLASFRFHLIDRQSPEPLILDNFGGFLGSVSATILFASPTLLWPLVVLFIRRPEPGFAAALTGLARWTAAISSVVMLVIAARSGVGIYWNITSYMLLVPLVPLLIGMGRALLVHLLVGVLLSGALVVNFSVLPIGLLLGFSPSFEDRMGYGFPEAAAAVERALAAEDAALVGATRYTIASQLAVQLENPDVVDFSGRRSAFSGWFNPAAHRGEGAIILADPDDFGIGALRDRFERLDLLETVPVIRHGRRIGAFEVWRGTGFRPD